MNSGSDKIGPLLKHLPDAFVYHQLVTDSEGKPVDCIILDVNPAFLSMMSLSRDEVIGKKVTEVFSGIENSSADWIVPYGAVALKGETIRFEQYLERCGCVYEITAYSDAPGFIAAIYRDGSEQNTYQESRQAHNMSVSSLQESGIDIELGNIINVEEFQSLLDEFYRLTHLPMSIIDIRGNVLVGVGWQDICMQFHRMHPETYKHCIESDTKLSAGISPGTFKIYRCKNNMLDIATPIMLNGIRVGNIFMGQFFFEGEDVDFELFRAQARKYGFDEDKYLQALQQVPLLRRDTVYQAMRFFTKLAHLISEQGYSNIRRLQALKGHIQAEENLRRSEGNLQATLHSIGDAVISTDNQGSVVRMNPVAEKLTGWTQEEAKGRPLVDVFTILHSHTRESVTNPVERVLASGRIVTLANHTLLISKDGTEYQISDSASPIRNDEGKTTGVVLVFRDITEEYCMQEKLRDSEEKLRSILNNMTDVVWSISWPEVKILYVSPSVERIYGRSAQEFYDNSNLYKESVHPDDQHCTDRAIEELLKEGEATRECRVVRPDGSIIWINDRSKLIYDENQKPMRVEGVARDITERKQAEEALALQNTILKTQQEVSLDGILVVDADDRIISFNQRFSDIWGIPEKIMALQSGEKILDFVLPKLVDPEQFASRIKYLYENKREKSYEEIRLVDGRILERYSAPMFDHNNHYYGRIWFYRDITERKQAEKELQENRNLLYSMFQSIQDGISILNPDLTIREVNHTMEKWYGHAAPIIGKKCYEVYHGRSEPCHPCPSIRTLEEKTVCSEIVPLMGEDTQGGWLEVYAYPLIDKTTERINGVVEFVRDITDRKQADEQIRYMSFHDSLTELYNRHFLEEEMQRLDTARQLPINIIMVDVNGLKLVNDTYGHAIGDEMLKAAAGILKESCREEDVIARWGGDEFVILLPQTADKEAEAICKRIKSNCQEVHVEQVPVSLSLGHACKESIDKELWKSLREAENRMYKQKLTDGRSSKSEILNTLLVTLGEKSQETERHIRRMQKVSRQIGEKIGLSDTELGRLELAVRLHDIGKINIPGDILSKKGSLTEEEWEIIKEHPEIGYRIARATEEFSHVAEEVLSHHESWDGSGYPQGLKGKNIPLIARLVAIADAYEVMSNGRPYKEPMDQEEIKKEFTRCAGTQFDPELVDIFLSILGE